MKQIKTFTTRIIAGANVATVAMMLIVGLSDHINPTDFPLLANLGLTFPIFIVVNLAFLAFWLIVKKRYAIITFVGLLIGYVPIRTYCPLNIRADAPEGCIKVMSYNVYNFSTWTEQSQRSEILDYIKEQNPDILCLQEVGLWGWKEEMVDSVLGGIYHYRDSADCQGTGDAVHIFSKMPIVGKDHIKYASRANSSAAFHIVMGKEDTTTVVVNHFESTGLSLEDRSAFHAMMKGGVSRNDAERESRLLWQKLAEATAIRAPQADAVAKYVEARKNKSIILVGDFNDSPISYVHYRLASLLNDCYVASGNGPGISYHYNAFYVRIDNIMCSDDWMPYDCHIDNNIKASDHYPIVCMLKKRGTN